MEKRIAVFVGSLRTASWSRKVARALIAPHSLQPEIVEIGQLPLYNQDFDDSGNPPAAWTAFRQQVKVYDAVLFVTPEYNRSVPAPLKNAIDVGSRPYGKSVWDRKTGRGGQHFTRRDRRIRRQPPPAAIIRFSQRAVHANAGGVYRRHCQKV